MSWSTNIFSPTFLRRSCAPRGWAAVGGGISGTLVLVMRMYILTEREWEEDPIRTRDPRASLLTDIYCAQKCVRAAINLRIHTKFLIYIFSAECFSLFLPFSLTLFPSLLLPPWLSCRPLFSLLHPLFSFCTRCFVFFLWLSSWIFCFSRLSCVDTNLVVLCQKKPCSLSREMSPKLEWINEIIREMKKRLVRRSNSTLFSLSGYKWRLPKLQFRVITENGECQNLAEKRQTFGGREISKTTRVDTVFRKRAS